MVKPKRKRKPNKRPARKRPPASSSQEYAALDVDVEMVRRYLCLNFHRPIGELRVLANDDTLSFGESSIIQVMLRINNTGDVYALNALYDRLVGPILRRIHLTGERPFAEWEMDKLMEEKHRLSKANRETLEMIEKEQKLVKLVEAGEIKPGDYTGEPQAKQSETGVKSYVYRQDGSSTPPSDKTGSD